MGSWTLAGATVVDGTGTARRTADVVIEDDRIAAIGSGERRGTVIDAEGLVAVPGFVDIHSHVDWIAPLAAGPELLQANVRQGITTSLGGNCGISPAPLGSSFNRGAIEQMLLVGSVTADLGWSWSSVREYLDEIERRGLPFNVADLRRPQHAPCHRPRRVSAGADSHRAGGDGSSARRRPRRRCRRALRRPRVLPRPLRRAVGGGEARPDRSRGATPSSPFTRGASRSSSTPRWTRRSGSPGRPAAGSSSRT